MIIDANDLKKKKAKVDKGTLKDVKIKNKEFIKENLLYLNTKGEENEQK